jgi:hypothetical protein
MNLVSFLKNNTRNGNEELTQGFLLPVIPTFTKKSPFEDDHGEANPGGNICEDGAENDHRPGINWRFARSG